MPLAVHQHRHGGTTGVAACAFRIDPDLDQRFQMTQQGIIEQSGAIDLGIQPVKGQCGGDTETQRELRLNRRGRIAVAAIDGRFLVNIQCDPLDLLWREPEAQDLGGIGAVMDMADRRIGLQIAVQNFIMACPDPIDRLAGQADAGIIHQPPFGSRHACQSRPRALDPQNCGMTQIGIAAGRPRPHRQIEAHRHLTGHDPDSGDHLVLRQPQRMPCCDCGSQSGPVAIDMHALFDAQGMAQPRPDFIADNQSLQHPAQGLVTAQRVKGRQSRQSGASMGSGMALAGFVPTGRRGKQLRGGQHRQARRTTHHDRTGIVIGKSLCNPAHGFGPQSGQHAAIGIKHDPAGALLYGLVGQRAVLFQP